MNLFFLIKEGIVNLSRARLATVISIISIALALTLIGISLVVGQNLKNVFTQFYRQIEIEAFLDPSVTKNETKNIQDKIKKYPEVSDTRFVSPEAALKEFQQSFGEDLSGVLEKNPLPPSLRIVLKPNFSDPERIDSLSVNLKKIPGVQEVIYHQEIIRFLHKYFKLTVVLGSLLALLLFVIVTILIFNTIRLSIHSRKNIIEIMHLVGATNFFIKSPFIIEGMIQGVIGGSIAALILKVFVKGVQEIIFAQIAVPNNLWVLIIVTGLLFGLTGSFISVNRHL